MRSAHTTSESGVVLAGVPGADTTQLAVARVCCRPSWGRGRGPADPASLRARDRTPGSEFSRNRLGVPNPTPNSWGAPPALKAAVSLPAKWG